MKIHHVGYLTKNIDASLREFAALGFEIERGAAEDSVRGVRIAFLRNGEYRVELICPDGPDSPMYPLLKRYGNTPYHFCYMVEDLPRAMEELSGKGYTVFDPPKAAPCIEGKQVAFLLHRDVGIVELLEATQDPWN